MEGYDAVTSVLMMIPKGSGGGARVLADVLTRNLIASGHVVHFAEVGPESVEIGDHALKGKDRLDLIVDFIQQSGVDLVHAHLQTYWLAARASRAAGIPSIRTIHGRLTRPGMLSPRERLGTWASVTMWKQRLVSVSDVVSNDILTYYPMFVKDRDLFEIVNGVEIPLHAPSQLNHQDNMLRLFFSGRFEKSKGFLTLIDAFQELYKIHEDSQLLLVGDGPLRHLIDKASVAKQSICATSGWVSHEESQRLLKSSNVFVLPSYSEGLSMSLMEAMLQGLVPIVSEAACANRIVENELNGFITRTGSTESLLDTLLLARKRLSQFGDMRHAAIQTVSERFSASRMTDGYVSLYTSLCS